MVEPIVIDGVSYPNIHVVSIKRSFSVLDGPNAGRVLTGRMERDVIGTYYNYSMEVDASESAPAEYDNFYEVISTPQDSHTIQVPYGQGTLTFEAYITNGDDNLDIIGENANRWGDLSINFIAISPQRVPT